MSEETPEFKVTDRRLFNPDGSPRELTPEERAATEQAKAARERAALNETPPPTPAQPEPEVTGQKASAATDTPVSEPEPELPDADDPASFLSFLMSIASNAASSLGMMEHPVTHQREVDLELGKHWIDVLGMLQRKTKGNLDAQEAKMLEGLLADLRMQYVSLANATPQKAAQTFTGRDITGGK